MCSVVITDLTSGWWLNNRTEHGHIIFEIKMDCCAVNSLRDQFWVSLTRANQRTPAGLPPVHHLLLFAVSGSSGKATLGLGPFKVDLLDHQ